MGWKILAALNGLFVVVAIGKLAATGGQTTVGEFLGLAVSTIAAAGVAGFAFRKPSLTPLLWRVFAGVIGLVALVQGIEMVSTLRVASLANPIGAVAHLLIVATMVAFSVLTWLGVWRYAGWLQGPRAQALA
jgi:phosphatidylserine synthase